MAPDLMASTAVGGGPVPGDHDNRQRLVERMQLAQDLHAVHPWHLDVEQDEIGPIALHQRNGVRAIAGAHELVLFVFEDHPQRIADGGLVINDQDAGLHRRIFNLRSQSYDRWTHRRLKIEDDQFSILTVWSARCSISGL